MGLAKCSTTRVELDGGIRWLTENPCIVFCAVQDENDEQPMFSFPTYNTSIDEDIRENMIVLRVTATDMDTPPNAMLRFSISSMTGECRGCSANQQTSLSLHFLLGPDPISSDPNPPSGSFIIDPLVGDIRTQGWPLPEQSAW